MKERPILFSAPMVRALLSGKKTQTRRVVRCLCNNTHMGKLLGEWDLSVPPWRWDGKKSLWRLMSRQPPSPGDWVESFQTAVDDHATAAVRCPYGKPGDRLWVRETFIAGKAVGGYAPGVDPDLDPDGRTIDVIYRADAGPNELTAGPWTPSIYMPRWASRITLEVTDVRVERLQELTPADAIAEGVFQDGQYATEPGLPYPVATFAALWRNLNGVGSWAANPWVWVVTFRPVLNAESA